MRRTLACVPILFAFAACVSDKAPPPAAPLATEDFESAAVGTVPAGWTPAENAGEGTPAQWAVVEDTSAPRGQRVFAVKTNNREAVFNLCVFGGAVAADVDVAVHIKPQGGGEDQGGGVMFRLLDEKNYYLTRWNPLESNVRLYSVINGKRTTIGDATIEVVPGWHRLTARAVGSRLTVLFDGASVIETVNETITKPGKTGLWTKADASSAFDGFDVRAEAPPAE